MDTGNLLNLIDAAATARDKAYAPYSRFRVGAAVLDESGKIFTGCNIENSSFGLTVCAERVAIFNSLSTGHRAVRAVAVVSDGELCFPCGACLQVIYEFSKDAVIIVGDRKHYVTKQINDLLPFGFDLESSLKKKNAR